MLLGALVDAGADLAAVQRAVDAVVPGSVRLERFEVLRAGLRAAKVDVVVLVDDPPHRRWTEVRAMLTGATLDPFTRARALDAFARLARAEGRVHGTSPEDVHFHEVGALDSVADVVGVCEALRLLDVGTVSATAVAVGAGRARVAHGDVPVPVPAVAELVLGWPVTAGVPTQPDDGAHHWHPDDDRSGHGHRHDGDHDHHDRDRDRDHDHHGSDRADHSGRGPGDPSPAVPVRPRQVGELATPTGVALVRALATSAGPLPAMTPEAVGVGAGTKDVPGRANVVRVVLGQLASPRPAHAPAGSRDDARGPAGSQDDAPVTAGSHEEALQVVQLEANVDDLDPRLWPGVLTALLGAGAVDAWLSPILMKKGRPAHTVHALCPAGAADDVATALFATTSTIGVRQHAPLHRRVLGRTWRAVDVGGAQVRVKVAHDTVAVRQVTPEFDDVVAAAALLALPERIVLDRARLAADEAGLRVGGALHGEIPDGLPDAPPQEER